MSAVATRRPAVKAPAKRAVSKAHDTASAASGSQEDIRREFHDVVNITAGALERWLATDESHTVGAKDGVTGRTTAGPESVGHRSGRRIVKLLGKPAHDLTAGDVAHMRKVVGYVRRHLAQHPAVEDVKTSRWRYSLMNWGHDPTKK